jgi:hypothetical protein
MKFGTRFNEYPASQSDLIIQWKIDEKSLPLPGIEFWPSSPVEIPLYSLRVLVKLIKTKMD